MKIDIWSDIACPFCYIGKRNLDLALKQFPHADKVKVTMKSFELDPRAPKNQSISVHQMLAQKYGLTLEQAKDMNASVSERANEVGLKFDLDKTIPANTFDAHRLLHLAHQRGLQEIAQEWLFAAYFCEGKDVSDTQILQEIGMSIGLSDDDLKELVTTDRYSEDVRRDEAKAHEYGLKGVPAFIINEKYLVSGAQPASVLGSALEQAWNEIQNPHTNE